MSYKLEKRTDNLYTPLNATSFSSSLCLCCGADPRHVYDAEGRYRVGYDASRGLNARGHCAECANLRQGWGHTKSREER